MEILLISFLMYVIFISSLSHSIEFRHSSSPLCKNHKKPKVDKKILTSRHVYIDQEICIFHVQMLKTVSISFINFELVRTLYLVGLLSNL